MRIAFVTFNMPDFDKVGGGGAERQFAMLHKYSENTKHSFFYLSTKKGISHLLKLNIINPDGLYYGLNDDIKVPKKILYLKYLFFLVKNRIQIIHTINYFKNDDIYIKLLKYIPKFIRPKVVINIMDCRMASAIKTNIETENKLLDRYHFLFNEANLSGIYSWYKDFVEVVNEKNYINSNPIIKATDYCFTDLHKFKPKTKQNIIVFAARLDNQKNPIMFLNILKELRTIKPSFLKNYKIIICGKGPLEQEVNKLVNELKTDLKISLRTDLKEMTELFSISKIFISTQELENFTSLSMLEAMASGNIIVSRNVGQTNYFVKDKENGFLADENEKLSLGFSLIEAINLNESDFNKMSKFSIEIATKQHSIENFSKQLIKFYQKVLSKS